MSMKAIEELIKKFESFSPGFTSEWKDDDLWNDPEDPSIHSLFSFYSHFIAERLDEDDSVDKKLLFSYIESLMISKDKTLRDAAATCFLENLLHVVWHKFNGDNFFQYLGTESIKFLKTWDEFNGVKTKGLW